MVTSFVNGLVTFVLPIMNKIRAQDFVPEDPMETEIRDFLEPVYGSEFTFSPCRLFSMEGNNNMEKRLLNIEEFCQYMGIGKTKARELLRGRNGFGVQIGNR